MGPKEKLLLIWHFYPTPIDTHGHFQMYPCTHYHILPGIDNDVYVHRCKHIHIHPCTLSSIYPNSLRIFLYLKHSLQGSELYECSAVVSGFGTHTHTHTSELVLILFGIYTMQNIPGPKVFQQWGLLAEWDLVTFLHALSITSLPGVLPKCVPPKSLRRTGTSSPKHSTFHPILSLIKLLPFLDPPHSHISALPTSWRT